MHTPIPYCSSAMLNSWEKLPESLHNVVANMQMTYSSTALYREAEEILDWCLEVIMGLNEI